MTPVSVKLSKEQREVMKPEYLYQLRAFTRKVNASTKYYANPNRCKNCDGIIPLVGNQKPFQARKKECCSLTCAQRYYWDNKQNWTKPEIKTKGEVTMSFLRAHAKRVFGKKKGCLICGFEHVDICHVKAVKKFSKDATLGEINRAENLIGLCPNHHWLFDKGKLQLPEINQ